VSKHLAPLPPGTDVSVENWLENTKYSKSRKAQLYDLYIRELKMPPNSRVKAFIKRESYASYKNPRGIYSRSDSFKIFLGPYIKVVEEAVFKSNYFIKKIPVEDRAKYIVDRFGLQNGATLDDKSFLLRILSTDYTSFEASFLPELMDAVEMVLYEYMLQNVRDGPEIVRVMRKVLMGKNKINFAGKLLVQMIAHRMSGEMNTSLGNGFSNLMVYLFNCEELKCRQTDCVVEGDDLLGLYVGPKFDVRMYERFGFIIKMDYLSSTNKASFCGQIFDYDSLTVIADPLKILLNFGWADQQYVNASAQTRLKLLRAKAMSFLALYPGCPIIQSLALAHIRLTMNIVPDFRVLDPWLRQHISLKLENITEERARVVQPSARVLMQDVFHVSWDSQVQLEAYFDSLTEVQPLQHPAIYEMCSSVHFDYDRDYVRLRGEPKPFARAAWC